ncbi:hypothetical protein B0H21DRAFT_701780 [Amylocystis lapponica]|nr:hypothetical protein B0H21DRAFT_701780 [Amylocystis lapponica]
MANEIERRALFVSHDPSYYQDFASYASGARPIEAMTSATYSFPRNAALGFVGRLFGQPLPLPHPPVTVLMHGLQPGHCWPMEGTSGHLGIKLSSPVHVTNVTVDHIPNIVAANIYSAPRHFVLWGFIDRSTILDTESIERCRAPVPLWTNIPDGVMPCPLTAFEYNIDRSYHVQNFEVEDWAQTFKVDQVVFQILDNWGSSESTCLYRLRVHGEV